MIPGRSGTSDAARSGADGAAAGVEARVVVRRARFEVRVALRAEPGETVAVMGPSGAGKSTLLGALAGLVPLADGEIAVGGRVVDRVAAPRVRTAPMHRGIVLLGQDPRLFPHLSARENVAFGLRAAGMPRAQARAEADAWLDRVGLSGAGSARPDRLSGGEQQRVAVARALAASPRVVLLDEPLVALDPATAADLRSLLRERLAGVTTVAVTHDAVDAVALGDRLTVIEAGALVQSGEVREVLEAPASAFVARIAGRERLEGIARAGAWEADGVRLTAADAASRRAAAHDGTALAAVFRPADVRLVPAGAPAGENAWEATVVRLEPTLAGVRVAAALGAAEVDVAIAGGLRPGDRVRLAVAPAHVRLVRSA